MADASGKKVRKGSARLARQRVVRRHARVRLMRNMALAVAALAALAGIELMVVRGSSSGVDFGGDLRVGGRLDHLTLPALQGNGTIDYETFRDKPVVLNFFASWCPNCISEMPGFQQVHQEVGARVAFLGVSQSDARDASMRLAQQTGVSYPAGIDKNGVFFHAVGSLGMPTTLFIEPGGRIAYIQVGALDPATLKRDIARYLGVSV